MARKLTPALAFAMASFGHTPETWYTTISVVTRRSFLALSRRELRRLKELGFDVVPRRTTKVRRKKSQ